jgi:hypothetical protein
MTPPGRAGSGARGRGTPAGPGWLPAVALALALAAAVVAAALVSRTVGWPLVHDAPVMHYVAARILAGDAPYRDLFDMNFPVVYLAHMLALRLLGPGDAAFRMFDLALVAATVAGLAVALRPYGPVAMIAAGALFALYHVSGGPWMIGQRELVLCGLIAWVMAAGVGYVDRAQGWRLGLGGIALGLAAWTKPQAAVLGLPLAWVAWRGPERVRALGSLGAGLAVPSLGVLAWLWAAQALAAFVEVMTGYVIPLYSRLGRTSLVRALWEWDFGWPVLGGLGTWMGLGLLGLWRVGRLDARAAILAGGVLYGAGHFALQGKGWPYQLYPLALAAVALGAAGLGAAVAAHRRLLSLMLLGVLAVTAGGLWGKGVRNLRPDWIARKHTRVQLVAALLRPAVATGGTVQVLDTTGGGIHALYLLRARQPTRFIYDFPFYHDVDHPTVRRLRSELLDGLRARPPGAVVLFEEGWPDGGYERLARFPALARWVETGYELTETGPGFRIYAARRDR